MTEALLIALIALVAITLVALCWAVIALALVLRQQVPLIREQVTQIRRQVDDLHLRAGQVLEHTIPALEGAAKTLEEAQRALHEVAESAQNLHYVSDNLRHKLEVADQVGAKLRRLPEKTARTLGRLVHWGFQLGGQALSKQVERRRRREHPTIYRSEEKAETPLLNAGIRPGEESAIETPVPESSGVSPAPEPVSADSSAVNAETSSATEPTHNKEG